MTHSKDGHTARGAWLNADDLESLEELKSDLQGVSSSHVVRLGIRLLRSLSARQLRAVQRQYGDARFPSSRGVPS